jgi:hypothetical protein
MAEKKQLDHAKIAGILGASSVKFKGYTAEEQTGGSWAVWGDNPDVPICRVSAGKEFHTPEEARAIAVRIAQALNDYGSNQETGSAMENDA